MKHSMQQIRLHARVCLFDPRRLECQLLVCFVGLICWRYYPPESWGPGFFFMHYSGMHLRLDATGGKDFLRDATLFRDKRTRMQTKLRAYYVYAFRLHPPHRPFFSFFFLSFFLAFSFYIICNDRNRQQAFTNYSIKQFKLRPGKVQVKVRHVLLELQQQCECFPYLNNNFFVWPPFPQAFRTSIPVLWV